MVQVYLIGKAILLGIVEGLTEFLPVSSTGHLILFGHFLNFQGAFATSFLIMIQLGAIVAVVIFYRQKIWGALHHLGQGQWGRHLLIQVFVAVLPSFAVALVFKDLIKSLFGNIMVVAITLILGALLLQGAEMIGNRRKKQNKTIKNQLEELTWKDSLMVGLFQCLALVPGMSRSGSTISGGLIKGLSPRLAAELSFFMAIPVMAGAFLFEMKDLVIPGITEGIALGIGFVVSFLVAYGVVGFFLNFISKHRFIGFVWYRLGVGFLLLILILTGTIKG